MVLNDKATKCLIIALIIDIILYICWFTTDDIVFEILAVLLSLSLPVIPFVAMNKEEQKQGIKAAQEAQKIEELKHPARVYRCPCCRRKAGYNIEALSKIISPESLGLSSNINGKTYQCANCKYKW